MPSGNKQPWGLPLLQGLDSIQPYLLWVDFQSLNIVVSFYSSSRVIIAVYEKVSHILGTLPLPKLEIPRDLLKRLKSR